MSLDHLRALLHSDTDLVDDWESALFEVARKAREALRGSRALVALPEGDSWRAFVDSGQVLAGAAVSLVASNSVLAAAFADGPARETVTLNDLKRSGSMNAQSIHSVLAVVLRRHGHPPVGDLRRTPIGVLYLDRRSDLTPFDADDELWARDFAALTERSLTLIELLSQARRERDAARLESETLRTRQFNAELDVLESRDPRFLEAVGRVLSRAAKADRVTVLLQGPTGSGKTHLARRFHALSKRHERPFVTLDCGQASNADVLAAELFGFSRKSGFTVDAAGRPGKALLADGGILFIDEVNSMPLELQPRLLRLVESGRYSAMGSGEEVRVDIQVIAATNEDLKLAVRERRFREDLYFRLSQITLSLPSLSERRADVLPLAERLLVSAARRFGSDALHFSADALALLENFAWERAGNIRGLEHTIERTVLMLDGGRHRIERDDIILSELLELESSPAIAMAPGLPPPATAPITRADTERSLRELLVDKIKLYKGVLARIAEDPALIQQMGTAGRVIPTSTLRQRIAKLGLIETLDAEREANDATLDEVTAALKTHGNGVDAAKALGITRDRLVWRLRQAGLTIGRVLGTDGEEVSG
jgi:transcriptional regulator with GAF, ATPase, and Fis domain